MTPSNFQAKVTERFKLRRKRQAGQTGPFQPTNRVNKFLSQAIEARYAKWDFRAIITSSLTLTYATYM